MKPLPDDQYYYYKFINDDGWIICLERVMYGTRVVIYHKDDLMWVSGNFCGGDNPEMVEVLFMALYRWLHDCPTDINNVCGLLHSHQRTRPFGKDFEFMWRVSELPKRHDISLDHPDGIFRLQTVRT